MSTAVSLRSLIRPVSPHDEELERLADQRANGNITEREYQSAKRDVEAARREVAVR